jgi:hypothetical protein
MEYSEMRKLTTKDFIARASKTHGNKYDYSKSIYSGVKEKIVITCNKHGDFRQSAGAHLQGFGCKSCSNNLKLTTQEFIKRAKEIHGNKYDYSKSEYKNRYEKITIGCKIHGYFFQSPVNHLYGEQGCPVCYGNFKKSSKDFIENAIQQHGDLYDYSKVDYSSAHSDITITCKIHGDFLQTPHNHLKGHGCPICNSSRGELKIEKWLKDNHVNYIRQKTFDDLRNPKTNKKLPFDFFIPLKNILIEYDGEQHFKCIHHGRHKMTNRELKNNQRRDSLKTKWAKNNQVQLLRIPYTEFSNIGTILASNI